MTALEAYLAGSLSLIFLVALGLFTLVVLVKREPVERDQIGKKRRRIQRRPSSCC